MTILRHPEQANQRKIERGNCAESIETKTFPIFKEKQQIENRFEKKDILKPQFKSMNYLDYDIDFMKVELFCFPP